MKKLRAAVIGAGYFSHFHYDAWSRIENVEIVACCDTDEGRGNSVSAQYNIPAVFTDAREMLDKCEVDFVDIVTRPDTHLAIVEQIAQRGIAMICQKPLAPTLDEAKAIVDIAMRARVRLMVHENFRFQPWYREIKKMLDAGTIGNRLHTISYRNRAGDGYGDDAYMARQPYFQTMKKFLIHEAGIHTIDTFRYLGGEIRRVWCVTRKLNPVIAGEDTAISIMEFEKNGLGLYDANRFNESTSEDQRYTFGEVMVEADRGTIRLYDDGRLTIQMLGKAERDHIYAHSTKGFAGDCVFTTQQHFVDGLIANSPFETDGPNYLRSLAVQEAMYRSAESGQWEAPILSKGVNRWE
ncbi:Gfo/Idh/MocA family protein [Rubripirellula reticaptiva]|uniref:4-carboxy-2-hydroxymuconate-6-semialdehyde dehydrogenase n=1 Tax=Rubripirellula reticaptiva TaxID=2528013 RepID=A0A5C6EGU5_9BACT|nr:Gfo/Idh/MocA family oxidoreductase [Rubripirellula reticaptiva]TWU48028.1 4-carboxy-2-hydroxymuconate-6-semialdehyde dehydrogenase [Rubripirellula reticaptiva]